MDTAITGASNESQAEIDRLAMLQEIDQRLRERRLTATALDQEIQARATELAAKQEAVRALRATKAELEARRTQLEQETEEEDRRMKERRMRLNRVRSDKELQAVRREIELGKESTQRMETEQLTCEEQLEGNVQALAAAEAELDALESPAQQEISEKRLRLTTLEQDAAQDETLRQQLAQHLDGAVRSKYEQIFARRGGLAVVAVRNGTCTGCHMHVPPQLFNEIQKTRDVRLCPNCHRILFWRPEAPAPDGA